MADGDEYRDMRPMLSEIDLGAAPTGWKPEVWPLPEGATGKALIFQDTDPAGGRLRQPAERFRCHWEGLIDDDYRFSPTFTFGDVVEAVEWARETAPIVIVHLVDERGQRMAFSAGREQPSDPLPGWPPSDR